MKAEAEFWAKVDRTGDCWLWTAGGSRSTGYGWVNWRGTNFLVHRFAYELQIGPIPTGFTIDHVCHNRDEGCEGGACSHRRCVNPAHLEAVSRGVNTLRGKTITGNNSRKMECKHGHPFDEVNTRYLPNGERECKECQRIKGRKRHLVLREDPAWRKRNSERWERWAAENPEKARRRGKS